MPPATRLQNRPPLAVRAQVSSPAVYTDFFPGHVPHRKNPFARPRGDVLSLLQADALADAALPSEGPSRIASRCRCVVPWAGGPPLRAAAGSAACQCSPVLGRVEQVVEPHCLRAASESTSSWQQLTTRAPSLLAVQLRQWSALRRWKDQPSLVALPLCTHFNDSVNAERDELGGRILGETHRIRGRPSAP